MAKHVRTYKFQELPEAHWKRVGTKPVQSIKPGQWWEVECQYCGIIAERSTADINADRYKCTCRVREKNRVILTIEGHESTLTQLLKLNPGVNPSSVYVRLSNRNKGVGSHRNYTDEQILFGAGGSPKAGSYDDLLANRIKATAIMSGFASNAKTRMNKLMDDMLGDELVKLITVSTKPQRLPPLAGGEFEMNVTGLTIHDLWYGDQKEDIAEFLGFETFTSPEDKSARLALFIPVNLVEWQALTPLEVMALTSILVK